MSEAAPNPVVDVLNHREQSLIAAAMLCGRTSILRRHADGERLSAVASAAGAASLRELLMPGSEADVTSPHFAAAQFVRRRAEEERLFAAEAVARLPAMWLGVIGASPQQVRGALVRLGVDIAASVARPMGSHAAAEFLSPLGAPLARRAAEQRARRDVPRPPVTMLAAWERAYRESPMRGESLAYACGLRILGGLLRRLPQDDQALAARVARTAIVRALLEAQPVAPLAEDDGRLEAGIVAWMLADARRG